MAAVHGVPEATSRSRLNTTRMACCRPHSCFPCTESLCRPHSCFPFTDSVRVAPTHKHKTGSNGYQLERVWCLLVQFSNLYTAVDTPVQVSDGKEAETQEPLSGNSCDDPQ